MLTILCLFLCITFLLQIYCVSIGIHHDFKSFEIELLFKGYFIGFSSYNRHIQNPVNGILHHRLDANLHRG